MKGLRSTVAYLKRQEKKIQEIVKDEVADTAGEIELEAIRNAPGARDPIQLQGGGAMQIEDNIRSFIHSEIRNEGFTGSVYVSEQASKFFVYVEFGTGSDAARYVPTLPKEFQDFARRYYVNGQGRIIGNPFLLPAYFKHSAVFIENIKRALRGVG